MANPGAGGESVEFGIETSIAKTKFFRPEDPFYLAGDHLPQSEIGNTTRSSA